MPHVPIGALALIGATAATLGRVTLAKLSRAMVPRRFLDEPTRKNIGAIKDGLEKRRVFTFATFLAYTLISPLPSNYLFIAYGLTTLRLAFVAFPFFVGRLASYSFWVTTASAVGDRPGLGFHRVSVLRGNLLHRFAALAHPDNLHLYSN